MHTLECGTNCSFLKIFKFLFINLSTDVIASRWAAFSLNVIICIFVYFSAGENCDLFIFT